MSQDIAEPANPIISTSGSLLDALYDFVRVYGLPALNADYIFHANQNRMSLPPDTEEYAVIDILTSVPHGRPIQETIAGENGSPDQLVIGSLFEYLVQIDFCSEDDKARQRAMTIANIGPTFIGPQFFGKYGCSFLYADNPRDMTFVGDANQYVSRWMITIHVSMPELTMVDFECFDTVAIERLENVDVHHKGIALDPFSEPALLVGKG